MGDSGIICDEIIDVKETNFNEKNITCETQNVYILLVFLLITITLLVAVTIYCYVINIKQKILLPSHNTNNKLNRFCVYSINSKRVIKSWIQTYKATHTTLLMILSI